LSAAAKWFLDRGHVVSVPLEPASYDLIAEAVDGHLIKVQVKTTRKRTAGGRFTAALTRTIYDPEGPTNSAGKYRQVPYASGSVDYFFILTEDEQVYLIPFGEVAGARTVVLDRKYAAFRVG
jgi:hypothetical protein